MNTIGRRSHGASEFFILLNNKLNVFHGDPSQNATMRVVGGQHKEIHGWSPSVVRKVCGSDHRFVYPVTLPAIPPAVSEGGHRTIIVGAEDLGVTAG